MIGPAGTSGAPVCDERRHVTAADTASGRLIVVDAIDETAAAFYRHHDFQPVPDNPHRLILKLSTVGKVLGR